LPHQKFGAGNRYVARPELDTNLYA
jgi:hypothetical protein